MMKTLDLQAESSIRMLVQFKVSNFLSFKDEVVLSLYSTAIKEYSDTNVFESKTQNERLLKSAVLYGPNAAGKSNLLKAMEFMKTFVLDSAKDLQANELIDVEGYKLSSQSAKAPSSFEVIFVQDDKRFRYGFHVTKQRVSKEYLYEERKTKDKLIFERVYDKYIFEEAHLAYSALETRTRSNALFLSVMSQWNVAFAARILGWFQGLVFLRDISFKNYMTHTVNQLTDDRKRTMLNKILKVANLGFESLEVRRTPKIEESILLSLPDEVKRLVIQETSKEQPSQVVTVHKKYNEKGEHAGNVQFNLSEESLGTQKYFAMSGYILDALTQGGILCIDELDARLHPQIASLIVQFFNSRNVNLTNAQLIFSTHNSNLLSENILRRDQINLIEKDVFGASKLYSLMQIRNENNTSIRNDASFEKDYLEGKYGATPFKERPQLNLFDDGNNPTLFS